MNASLVFCATDDFYIKIKHRNKHDNEEQEQETGLKRDCEILTDDEHGMLFKRDTLYLTLMHFSVY